MQIKITSMLNLRLIIITNFDVFQSVFQSLFYAKNYR